MGGQLGSVLDVELGVSEDPVLLALGAQDSTQWVSLEWGQPV